MHTLVFAVAECPKRQLRKAGLTLAHSLSVQSVLVEGKATSSCGSGSHCIYSQEAEGDECCDPFFAVWEQPREGCHPHSEWLF